MMATMILQLPVRYLNSKQQPIKDRKAQNKIHKDILVEGHEHYEQEEPLCSIPSKTRSIYLSKKHPLPIASAKLSRHILHTTPTHIT